MYVDIQAYDKRPDTKIRHYYDKLNQILLSGTVIYISASGQKKSNPMVRLLRNVSPDSPAGISIFKSISGVIFLRNCLIALESIANNCVSINLRILFLSLSPSTSIITCFSKVVRLASFLIFS